MTPLLTIELGRAIARDREREMLRQSQLTAFRGDAKSLRSLFNTRGRTSRLRFNTRGRTSHQLRPAV
jgi:hypothetical protein